MIQRCLYTIFHALLIDTINNPFNNKTFQHSSIFFWMHTRCISNWNLHSRSAQLPGGLQTVPWVQIPERGGPPPSCSLESLLHPHRTARLWRGVWVLSGKPHCLDLEVNEWQFVWVCRVCEQNGYAEQLGWESRCTAMVNPVMSEVSCLSAYRTHLWKLRVTLLWPVA